MKFLAKYPVMPLSAPNAKAAASSMEYQDISGTFSIFVELLMIIVNLIPLIVILKWKKFRERTRTDDLVVALNLTYIVSVVIPTPLGHISYFNDKWYGGKKTCYFYQVTTTWFRLCCLFIVSILCVDKSIAVYLYMNRNYMERYDGKIKTLVSVISVVLLSLFISCLPIMGFGPTGNEKTRCESWISYSPKNENENIYIIVYLTCGFGNFLCAFLTNCYMGLNLRKMKKHLYTGNNNSGNGNQVRWQIEGTVVLHGVRMIMAVTILLYLTWFPALILITLQRTGFLISNISILYALLSTSLSGLLNPVLYGLFDHSYRRGYKKLFHSL
ncbi:hypothetical protein KUTeg_008949 [Tegillarca granosa]|uniref:G-protein coupled receptors family 1 profile domain-containing protein n=1 Tax=Tegillarca granosa TaxID=220873 RepID=A0ABQ9FAI6_TEGGR|nr:hypothetical protein KUTeg_008949 [Tegillarca granosa]